MGESISFSPHVLSSDTDRGECRLIALNLTHSYRSLEYPLRVDVSAPDIRASYFYRPKAARILVLSRSCHSGDTLSDQYRQPTCFLLTNSSSFGLNQASMCVLMKLCIHATEHRLIPRNSPMLLQTKKSILPIA